MQKARLTTPMYEVNSFMLNDTIFNIKNVENSVGNNVGENVGEKLNSAKRVFLNWYAQIHVLLSNSFLPYRMFQREQ